MKTRGTPFLIIFSNKLDQKIHIFLKALKKFVQKLKEFVQKLKDFVQKLKDFVQKLNVLELLGPVEFQFGVQKKPGL